MYFLKKVRDQSDFLHVDIASKFPTSLYYYLWLALPGIPKVPEITSLQYLQNFQKEAWEKFRFLHEDKYQSFQQTDTFIFSGHSQLICPMYPKQQICIIFTLFQERG